MFGMFGNLNVVRTCFHKIVNWESLPLTPNVGKKTFFPLNFPSFFFLSFFFSWAAPVAYGGSQARGQIGTAATGLCHSRSNVGS